MRKHSEEFKSAINRFGRELDSKITFGETELGNEQLNAVTPILQSSLLKSVMKGLDIDSNVDIPVGTILNYKFGVLIDDENYEYLDFENYIVYSSEKQEDTNSYNIVAYDKMLNSMVEYTTLKDTSKAFPMSVRDYIGAICNDINLTFKNKDEEFANFNKIIESDLYANLGYTYRDILDELAQVTASNIIINENDELEIKYITDTNDTINEEYLKDINVAFGQKYGPINSIVLSRSAGADNVYLQDEQSVADNGLCELKISDNQIMNGNDRSDYLPAILEKLNGLEYYINDFSSTGICYYEVADRYNVKIGDNTYTCVMFNDEIEISQGLEENIHTDLPEQAETDYTKADKTDRKINQTYLIVDKQNQKIESVVSQTDGFNERISQAEQTVDGFSQTVTSIEKTANDAKTTADNTSNNLKNNYSTTTQMNSAIKQSANSIQQSVSAQITDAEGNINKSVDGKLELYIKKGKEGKDDLISGFNLNANEVEINSDNFKLDKEGNITFNNGNASNLNINGGTINITRKINEYDHLPILIEQEVTDGHNIDKMNIQVAGGGLYTQTDTASFASPRGTMRNLVAITNSSGDSGTIILYNGNDTRGITLSGGFGIDQSNISGPVIRLSSKDGSDSKISLYSGDPSSSEQYYIETPYLRLSETPTASNHAVRLQDLNARCTYSSSSEMVVGYFDGKPLYRRVIYVNQLPKSGQQYYYHGIPNIKYITRVDCIIHQSDSENFFPITPRPNSGEYEIGVWATFTHVVFVVGYDRSNTSAYVTLEYTKTTDD